MGCRSQKQRAAGAQGWVPGVRTGGCGVEPLSVVKGTAGVFQVDSPVPTLMTAEPELGLPG